MPFWVEGCEERDGGIGRRDVNMICQKYTIYLYSRISVAQTLMSGLPGLF